MLFFLFLSEFAHLIHSFFLFSVSKDGTGGPLDDSLTNIQWLGKMNTCVLVSEPAKQTQDKENQVPAPQAAQVSCLFIFPPTRLWLLPPVCEQFLVWQEHKSEACCSMFPKIEQ